MVPLTHTLMNYYRLDCARFGSAPIWLLFRALPVLLGTGVLLLMLTHHAPVRASASGELDDEVGSGVMWFEGQGGRTHAVTLNTKVHVDIVGMIATVSLEQSFRNDSQGFVEGVYGFPMSDTAAVRFLEMEVGERRIVGKVREKAEAKKLYEAAKQQGKKASLVEQQRANLFTNRVANIGPGEVVRVRLEYVDTVQLAADVFSLRLPTTLTARYMPGNVLPQADPEEAGGLVLDPYLGWARNTDQVPDAAAISPVQHHRSGRDDSPLNPLEITVTLDMGMPLASVESPYHDIALQRRSGVYHLELADGRSEMDRDFVLQWRPVVGSAPQAAFFSESVGSQHYGLLMVVPPVAAKLPETIPREVVFVVDTSGSMGGVSIDQARASVTRALASLRAQDRFNIISFASSHRKLYPHSVSATRHNVERALEFVRLLTASGGTEMQSALLAALEDTGADELPEGAVRQVVFVTDGAVGNEDALYQTITRKLGQTRLFTVGIGSAPNSWFMRKAAQFGRGSHTHIGDLSEVESKMAALFEHLSRPAATDIAVSWPVEVEAWPSRAPDLYAGEPMLMAVKFGSELPAGEVAVEAMIGGTPWRQTIAMNPGEDPARLSSHAGVASVWARKKIAGLLDGLAQGESAEAVRASVLPIALTHQLLSPYTSFIAIEEIISRPAHEKLHSKAVPNTRPQGQTPQPFAFPRTATTGPAKLWLGTLLLFCALLLRVLRQGELDHVPA